MVNKPTFECTPMVVATWNADGISASKIELKLFLEEKDVSVLLVSKTHLKSGRGFQVEGFQCFRKILAQWVRDTPTDEGVCFRRPYQLSKGWKEG